MRRGSLPLHDIRSQDPVSSAIPRTVPGELSPEPTSGLSIDTLHQAVYHCVYTNRTLRRTPDGLKEDSALYERE